MTSSILSSPSLQRPHHDMASPPGRQARPTRLPPSPLPSSSTRPQPIPSSSRSIFTSTPQPIQGTRDYFSPREEPGWTVFGQLLEDDRTPGSRGYDTPVHSIRKGRSRGVSRQRQTQLPVVSASPDEPESSSPLAPAAFITSPPHQTISPPFHDNEPLPDVGFRPQSAAESHFSGFTRTESFRIGEPASCESSQKKAIRYF